MGEEVIVKLDSKNSTGPEDISKLCEYFRSRKRFPPIEPSSAHPFRSGVVFSALVRLDAFGDT
jgi:hypothetical protein